MFYQLMSVAVLLYFISTWLYRLFLSPIRHFPGPRLAALTFWYEGYYDIIRDGRYTWKIQEMHAKYGPVVRINPCELHVNDAEMYHAVYVGAGAGRRTDKWAWSARMFGTNDAIVGTTDHKLHHSRKNALAPFFSKVTVSRMEPLIQQKVDRLCERLLQCKGTNNSVNLSDAFTAFSADVIGSYVFGIEFGFLDDGKFSPEWREAMIELSRSTHLMKQFGWASPVLNRLADRWIAAVLATLYRPVKFLSHIRRSTREAIETARRKATPSKLSSNDSDEPEEKPQVHTVSVLESLLSSTTHQLPASELSTARLMDESVTLLGAGSVTIAQALTAALYFILATPRIETQLRTELASLYKTTTQPTWSQLSQLPYLTAVLNEALRLSYGVASRLPRISPDTDLVLPEPDEESTTTGTSRSSRCRVIPRGTPVSMTQMFLHDDPTIFKDPLTFEPERWIRSINSHDYDDVDHHKQHSSPHFLAVAADDDDHETTTTAAKDAAQEQDHNNRSTLSGDDDDHANNKNDDDEKMNNDARKAEIYRMRRFFVPFSRGTRACLGTNLAWAELYCCLAALFKPASSVAGAGAGAGTGTDGKLEFELFETQEKEVRVEHDYFNGAPAKGCKGVRVLVK